MTNDPLEDPLARHVRVERGLERVARLHAANAEAIAEARAYRDRPGCNPALADAHLDRLRSRASYLRAMHRSLLIEARELLGATEAVPA